MHNFSSLFRITLVATLFLLPGCAPTVRTTLLRSYPAHVESSAVLVYDLTDTVPDDAEFLGSIRIKDSGLAVDCNYEQVVGIAKTRTSKIGGNGLRIIWHRIPSPSGSSCHQIAADMLHIPDSTFTATYADNAALQTLHAAEYNIPKTIPTPGDPIETGPHTLTIAAGYSSIISKFHLQEGLSGNPKQGWQLSAAYQWTHPSGIGIGIRYSGYFTSASSRSIRLHYVGPELVLRQQTGAKWGFREYIGFGYAQYSESVKNAAIGFSGFGGHLGFSAEYKLSRHIGIHAGLEAYLTRLGFLNDSAAQHLNSKKGGISRLSLNAGLNFYL